MSEERTAAKWKIVAGIAAIVLTVGAGVGIFVGVSRATCKHVWNAGEITAEATCFTAGEITYTCEECGKKNKEETQPLQHVIDYLPPIATTCEEDGRDAGTVCTLCDTIITGGQKIPALGHHIVEDPEKAPTCLGTGKTKGSHCDRDGCDYIGIPQAIVPATGHSIVTVPGTAATCTTNGWTDEQSCEWCDYVGTASELLPALGHKDEDWDGECDVCEIDVCAEGMHVAEVIPAIAATCTTDGWTEGTRCTNCEEILTAPQLVPATGHTEEVIPAVAATCTTDGWTEGSKCSECGEVLTAQQVTAKLSHSVSDYVDYCERCDELIVQDVFITVNGAIAENEGNNVGLYSYWFFFEGGTGYVMIDNDRETEAFYLNYEEANLPESTAYYDVSRIDMEIVKEVIETEEGTYVQLYGSHFELPYVTGASDRVFMVDPYIEY